MSTEIKPASPLQILVENLKSDPNYLQDIDNIIDAIKTLAFALNRLNKTSEQQKNATQNSANTATNTYATAPTALRTEIKATTYTETDPLNDDVIKNALDWGIDENAILNFCHRYGIVAVRKQISFVASKHESSFKVNDLTITEQKRRFCLSLLGKLKFKSRY